MNCRGLGSKLSLMAVLCAISITAMAQTANVAAVTTASAATSAVPRLINYSGVLKDAGGKTLTGITGVTFLLYRDEQGGAPLWLETQSVTPDRMGHYSVQLGTASAHGLPSDMFVSGEARWLAVQVANEAEQARVLLVAVPYAMKAADAETVGGLPASAFMLAAPSSLPASTASTASHSSQAATAGTPAVGTTPVTTAGGAINKLAKFDAAADITNSLIFDNGTNVGIGSTTPSAKLDVNGGVTVRGLLYLPATGTATATGGKNSNSEDWVASVFNSGTSTAVTQTFQLRAEPAGNNTATASGTLNLLFGQGTTTPAETGFKISNKGVLTFAAGQTFPGTGTGTVKSVGLAAPATDFTVSGSPVTTSGTLNFAWNVAPTSADTANAIVKRDASGNFSAGTISASGLNASGTVSGAFGVFSGSTSGADVSVTNSGSGDGIDIASSSIGVNVTSGTQGIHAVTSGDAGVFEGGADGSYNLGPSAGVYSESDFDANFNTATYGFEFGSTARTQGVWGYSASGSGVGAYGELVSSTSTAVAYNGTSGVWGDSSARVGVNGTSDSNYGVVGVTADTSASGYSGAIFLNDSSVAGTILYAYAPNVGGLCSISNSGNLSCNGTKSAVVPVDGGSRKVALYAIEGSENWFEDAGSAHLSNGEAVVNVEQTFGQTINTDIDYHVFLTPNGDCKGLYVAQKSATSFVVRELGGGTSNIAFDYRIMAKRKGYEQVRLEDRTKLFSAPPRLVSTVKPTRKPSPQELQKQHRENAMSHRVAQLSKPNLGKAVLNKKP